MASLNSAATGSSAVRSTASSGTPPRCSKEPRNWHFEFLQSTCEFQCLLVSAAFRPLWNGEIVLLTLRRWPSISPHQRSESQGELGHGIAFPSSSRRTRAHLWACRLGFCVFFSPTLFCRVLCRGPQLSQDLVSEISHTDSSILAALRLLKPPNLQSLASSSRQTDGVVRTSAVRTHAWFPVASPHPRPIASGVCA